MKKPPAEGAGSEGDYSECDVASVAWVNRLWLPAGALLLAGLVLGFDWRYIPRPGKSRRPAPEKLESGPTVKRTFPSTLQLFFIGVFLIAVGYVVYLCISAHDWKNLGWLGAVIGVAVAGVWACRRLEGWFRFGWGAVLLVAAYLLITWLFSQDWRYGWSAAFFALVILNLGLYPWAQRHFEPSHWDPLTLSRYHRYAPHAALGGLLFFALACLIPGIRSPLIFGCFLLFGVVALYGFFVLFIRRWLPVAIGFFAFLTILAGLQPNHFRFDNLDFYGDKSKLDLEKRIEEELKEANEFDALLLSVKKDLKDAGYFEAKAWLDDFNIKKAELNKLKADLRAPKSESHRKLLEKRVADGEMELDEELASQHEAIKKSALEEVKEKLKKAKGDWVNLENNHRVLPLRVPPEPMRGLVVNWKAKELENNLLPLDHLDYKMGNPLVVVVVSGGGLRSAAWTFAVLQELELQLADKGIDFAKHVRLIAGASGGMLGSSYYVVTLPDGPAGKDDKGLGRQKFLEDKYNRLTQDCLTPVVQQMVLGDIPGFFAPWIAEKDRGKVLEEAWADNLENALDCPFSALRAGAQAGTLPSLVFTPMLIEDGRRLLISNLDLRNVLTNDGTLLGQDKTPYPTQLYSRDALELFRLFPEKDKKESEKFKLSTAVRMSATFAFFSPAVSLPTTLRRRVVDAGYFDNYGVSLASSWLFSSRNEAIFKENNIDRFLLIQIRDGSSHAKRFLRQVDRFTYSKRRTKD